MKINALKDLEEIISRIQNDNFSGVEIRALLIILRWHTNSKIIKELAHFVTHDDRNQGITQESVQEIFNKFINLIELGEVFSSDPIFQQVDIINQLYVSLKNLNLQNLNENLLKQYGSKIMLEILKIIAETKIVLDPNSKITECYLSSVESVKDGALNGYMVFFCYKLKDETKGLIKISPGTPIRIIGLMANFS
ncbi:MAG: hypothetical protein WAV10_03655 [Minisyncoccia bacterium]